MEDIYATKGSNVNNITLRQLIGRAVKYANGSSGTVGMGAEAIYYIIYLYIKIKYINLLH